MYKNGERPVLLLSKICRVMLRELREIALLDAQKCYAASRSTSALTNNSRFTVNDVIILSLVVILQ
jgi:hypothetical protein